ncbi:flagellar basal-body MS-ring/collar protein FliF [Endozoicomonas sp. Mp262]|uniref:flagellar basal-body MS-ring/collar protein FliF n=1 Tax=Endozoicomonas sp. Mp262 TaxID=2919499 RepID=UPI0021DB3B85
MAEKKKASGKKALTAIRKAVGQIRDYITEKPARQGMLLVMLAGVLAATIVAIIWSHNVSYQPLYGNQEMYDTSSIVEILESKGFAYQINPESGQVMVDAAKLREARMELSASGIKANLPDGLELLDKEQGLGTSQFIEGARYRRGLEGELVRTIISLNAVRNARVHLAIPKRSAFVRKQTKPSASVFIDLFPGSQLESRQVDAIVNLVASSVEGMEKSGVSVIDQNGNLLSRNINVGDGDIAMANNQIQIIKTIEQQYINRVGHLLDPIVGSSNYRVQVSADVSFDRIEQTAEQFDPRNRSVRSERGRERTGITDIAQGVPGSTSNQPPETINQNAGEDAAINPLTQNEYTRNYELNRTVRHTSYQQGQLQRLSIAVVLNNSPDVAEITGELTQERLDSMTRLIQDAVGFSTVRNDQVSIHTAPFISLPEQTFDPIPWWQDPNMLYYVRYGVGAILGLAVIIFLLRPITTQMLVAPELPAPVEEEEEEDDGKPKKAVLEHPELLDEYMTLNPPELSVFETQLNHIKKLAEQEPKKVAHVLKQWIYQEEN